MAKSRSLRPVAVGSNSRNALAVDADEYDLRGHTIDLSSTDLRREDFENDEFVNQTMLLQPESRPTNDAATQADGESSDDTSLSDDILALSVAHLVIPAAASAIVRAYPTSSSESRRVRSKLRGETRSSDRLSED